MTKVYKGNSNLLIAIYFKWYEPTTDITHLKYHIPVIIPYLVPDLYVPKQTKHLSFAPCAHWNTIG